MSPDSSKILSPSHLSSTKLNIDLIKIHLDAAMSTLDKDDPHGLYREFAQSQIDTADRILALIAYEFDVPYVRWTDNASRTSSAML